MVVMKPLRYECGRLDILFNSTQIPRAFIHYYYTPGVQNDHLFTCYAFKNGLGNDGL